MLLLLLLLLVITRVTHIKHTSLKHTHDWKQLRATHPPLHSKRKVGEHVPVEGNSTSFVKKASLNYRSTNSNGRPTMHMFRAMKKHNSLKCLYTQACYMLRLLLLLLVIHVTHIRHTSIKTLAGLETKKECMTGQKKRKQKKG